MTQTILPIQAHGHHYEIEDPDGIIGRALRTGSPYERKALERMQRLGIPAGATALDVGAHVGNHALWLAAVCRLKVIAAEPLTVEHLRRNVVLNEDLDITIWPFALGEESGRTLVHNAPANVAEAGELDGTVPVESLDGLDPPPLALIKIDVEGMEADVIRGGLETIERDRPVIYAEAQDEAAHERVARLLEPLGYGHTNTYGATPLEEWLCD